jgi:hypothetical protein
LFGSEARILRIYRVFILVFRTHIDCILIITSFFEIGEVFMSKATWLARIRNDDAITVPKTVRRAGFNSGKFVQVTIEEADVETSDKEQND